MVLSSADIFFFLKIRFFVVVVVFSKRKFGYIGRLSSSLDPDHGRWV